MKKLKSIKSWFPIKNIENGIIEVKGGKFCKIVEVFPINFELKSVAEKEDIIHKYKAFLKTCDFDMQILVQSKNNDLSEHINTILERLKKEKSENLKKLVNEYIKMINEQTLKTTITRRFFIAFNACDNKETKLSRELAINNLNEKTAKIIKTLGNCGNEIKDFSNNNFSIINGLYKQLNRETSEIQDIKAEWYEKY